MTKVAVSKWGNSTAIRLPKAVVEALGIKQGEIIEMTVQNGKGMFELVPSRPKRITIDWIVSEMKRLGPEQEPPSVEWGPDRGSEIINDDYSRRR